MLNGLSLFTGYSGIDLALSPYVRPILYCDIEQYAQAILLSRMHEGSIPFAPIWNDVTTMDGTKLRGMVDIIYGGFPCQDLSVAGKGKGLEGERSGLFKEIIRLATEASPTFIFLENVPAIRTRGCIQVQEALASIGYDTRWTTLSASQVGANHRRERWFLLAKSKCQRLQEGSNESSHCSEWGASDKSCDTGEASRAMAHACTEGLQGVKWTREDTGEACKGREVPHGSTPQCGNDSGTSQEAELPHSDCEGHGRDPNATTKEDHKGVWQDNGWTETSPFNSSWWGTEPDVGRVVNGATIKLDQIEYVGNRLLNKHTKEEIQETEIDKLYRADRIKALGNGVVPLQVRVAFEYLMGVNNGKTTR